MVIKTMEKGYVSLEKYSNFTIRHKQEDFAVIAMKPVGHYATESKHCTSAVSVELGCYPSETAAQKALEAIMEHWDAIKEAEYYGTENNFRYISNIFTMPEASKSKTEEFQTFIINGQEYTVPSKVIEEIRRQDMIKDGENIAENRDVYHTIREVDPEWEADEDFYYNLASMVEARIDSIAAEDDVIHALKCSVEKAKDEKRYAEKVDFVVKYLLNIANNQELNVFMGKDADETVLYNETDIRGVIAQMPELVFYEYYYKFKSIYDKQEPNSDSGFEPKKNPVYKWIIGISNSEADGVRLYNYEGTVEQIKNRLISLIKEDRENDKSGWDYGSENENEISDESDSDKKVFSGFGCYSEYHINYTAEMLTEIEKLSD